MPDQKIIANGINGLTGEYLLPEFTYAQISQIAQGEELDDDHVKDLIDRYNAAHVDHLGPIAGVDPDDLAQVGWGVVFAHSEADQADGIRAALKPLLDRRKQQAGDLYKEFVGPMAYRPDETAIDFCTRFGVGPGPVDPEKIPYYLLLVGSPAAIPFRFQYGLDASVAVGRLHFDTLAEYESYANGVVAAETGTVKRNRSLALFGVRNHNDNATNLSATQLVDPLSTELGDTAGWEVNLRLNDSATKANVLDCLAGNERPALLFTASHGLGFPKDDPQQRDYQGALLCQEWPGPFNPVNIDAHCLTGDDIDTSTKVDGLVAFHFACYGAGTPLLDDFAHTAMHKRLDIAAEPFVARLPQRLLGRPEGGALAVIGHVERAWGCSFIWPNAGSQIDVFTSACDTLLAGKPIGLAVEYFNDRYKQITVALNTELEEIKYGAVPDNQKMAFLWTANNDARAYVIVGDPAVRLAV